MGSSSSTQASYDGKDTFMVKHTRKFDEYNASVSGTTIQNVRHLDQGVYGVGLHKHIGDHTVGVNSYTNGYKSFDTQHNIGKNSTINTSTSISGVPTFHIGFHSEF